MRLASIPCDHSRSKRPWKGLDNAAEYTCSAVTDTNVEVIWRRKNACCHSTSTAAKSRSSRSSAAVACSYACRFSCRTLPSKASSRSTVNDSSGMVSSAAVSRANRSGSTRLSNAMIRRTTPLL